MKQLFISINLFFTLSCSFAQLEMPAIEDMPVRLTRSFGLSLDLGWNGLVGFGPTLQYYISPHFAIDGGIGLSSTGFKPGIRGRYLFLEKKFTPFVGIGFNYGFGAGNEDFVLENDDNGNTIEYYILHSPFLQLTAGGDLVGKGGFFLMFNLGYAILLKEENVVITSGTPTPLQQRAMNSAFGSGIVIEAGIGFVFINYRSNR
jgi:hypothetical protein